MGNSFSSEKVKALRASIKKGDLKSCQALIESIPAGKDEGCIDFIGGKNASTPVLQSIKYDRYSIFELLLTKSDPNFTYKNGWSPLFHSIEHDRPEFIRLLIKKGSNVNAVDRLMKTPLIMSIVYQRAGCLQVLLEQGGADPCISDEKGLTPLMHAAKADKSDCLTLLLSHASSKITINEIDDDGCCALHWASGTNRWDNISLLLQHGADVSIRNNDGLLAVECAGQKKYLGSRPDQIEETKEAFRKAFNEFVAKPAAVSTHSGVAEEVETTKVDEEELGPTLVSNIVVAGKSYLLSNDDDTVYDADTHYPVGKFDSISKSIIFH